MDIENDRVREKLKQVASKVKPKLVGLYKKYQKLDDRRRAYIHKKTQIRSRRDELKSKYLEELARLTRLTNAEKNELVKSSPDIKALLPSFQPLDEEEINDNNSPSDLWTRALSKRPETAIFLYRRDKDVLRYLQAIRFTHEQNKPGIQVEFVFLQNRVIRNTSVTVRLEYSPRGRLLRVVGNEVLWGSPEYQRIYESQNSYSLFRLFRTIGPNQKGLFSVLAVESFFNTLYLYTAKYAGYEYLTFQPKSKDDTLDDHSDRILAQIEAKKREEDHRGT